MTDYLTPSIVYTGHPRYANIEKHEDNKGKKQWNQTNAWYGIKYFVSCKTPVDPNYDNNNKLQWVFVWNKETNILSKDGIVVYGLMVRIVDKNPRFLPQNKWWEQSRERLKWDSYQKK